MLSCQSGASFLAAHRRWRAPPATLFFYQAQTQKYISPSQQPKIEIAIKQASRECWQWNGDDSSERALYFNCSQIGAQKRPSGEYYSLRIIFARAWFLHDWLRINHESERHRWADSISTWKELYAFGRWMWMLFIGNGTIRLIIYLQLLIFINICTLVLTVFSNRSSTTELCAH